MEVLLLILWLRSRSNRCSIAFLLVLVKGVAPFVECSIDWEDYHEREEQDHCEEFDRVFEES